MCLLWPFNSPFITEQLVCLCRKKCRDRTSCLHAFWDLTPCHSPAGPHSEHLLSWIPPLLRAFLCFRQQSLLPHTHWSMWRLFLPPDFTSVETQKAPSHLLPMAALILICLMITVLPLTTHINGIPSWSTSLPRFLHHTRYHLRLQP